LFNELALANIALLNEVTPKRIVTTCPHCLHTLKNEYPAFGGHFEVVHHSQLIDELLASGKLILNRAPSEAGQPASFTFHDPCYLGRHNRVIAAPRQVLAASGNSLVEMPRHGLKSFCCGAGGAQMWKEEEHGDQRVNASRFQEAQSSGARSLAVGCPFCLTMLSDAAKEANSEMQVFDLAEIIAAQLS
jgi:Fe-S oxidoreductase